MEQSKLEVPLQYGRLVTTENILTVSFNFYFFNGRSDLWKGGEAEIKGIKYFNHAECYPCFVKF